MDDKNTDDEKPTSTKKLNSGMHEDENNQEKESNSHTSCSQYSRTSNVDIDEASRDVKVKTAGRKREPRKKKGAKRPIGRIDKRRKPHRVPTKKAKPRRELSLCTIFSRISSRSMSRSPGCKYCGHRCCLRR